MTININDEHPLLAIDPKNSTLNHPKLEEAVYHEVFHAFQAAGSTPTEYSNLAGSTLSPRPILALESVAAAVGAKKLYDDWDSWNFTPSGSTQSKEVGIWQNTFYTEHVLNTQSLYLP